MILKVQDLNVHYGVIHALKGVNIEVEEGQIVSLIGSNGAGKTSLLRTISGLIKASSGSIRYMDQEIVNPKHPELLPSTGLVQVPEGRKIFAGMSVYENLLMGAYLRKDKDGIKEDLANVYARFPILDQRKHQDAATLSGGEQQMLAIGRALMSCPKILLLDEPSLGLAPLIIRDIMNIVLEIKKEGVTVIIVEQNAAQTLKIADYAYVLELGEIKTHGPAHELLHDPKLIEAYLGSH